MKMPAVTIQPAKRSDLVLKTSSNDIGNSDETNELSIEISNVNDTFAKGKTGQLEV